MNKLLFLLSLFGLFLLVQSCASDEGCTDPSATNFNPNASVEDGSCAYSFPAGYSLAAHTELMHKVYGGSGNNDDELASGMVVDLAGNIYFTLNTNDAFANNNILVGKINADGSLGWTKEWDGDYDDASPDSGENGETGGTANSISIDSDGNIYVAGRTSDVSQNNIFSMLILKINPADGSLLWKKAWKHEWPSGSPIAANDADGYGIDATGDYVYVTGSTADNKIPIIALQKSNGTAFFELSVDVQAGTRDVGYVCKADALGNLFVGGISGSIAQLTKITGATSSNPSLAWCKHIDLGFASRINSIDIDGSEVYLSCDRRGASTYFSVIKLDTDGQLIWGQTFPGLSDRNNTHVVNVIGNSVYIGGRIYREDLDPQMGDGLLVKLAKSDGSLEWSGTYFTRSAEHRIKGIEAIGNEVYVYGQVYGSNSNSNEFFGSWIQNADYVDAYTPAINSLSPVLSSPANSEIRNAIGTYSNAHSSYVLQNATEKTTNAAPDGDVFVMKLTLN